MMTVETQLRIMERELKRKEEERVAAYNRGFAEGVAKGRAKVKAEGEALANESWRKLLGHLLDEGRLSQAEVDNLMRKYGIK